MKLNQARYIFFLALVILVACKSSNEDEEKLRNQLIGKWEIAEAYRNGNLAESLDDLFFEFFEDGKMRTNILGSSSQSDYEIDGQNVLQGGEDGVEVNYQIEEVSDSTLVLSTVLRRYDFSFSLKRFKEVE